MRTLGDLYLIPNMLGEVRVTEVLPLKVKEIVLLCNHFIVENEKNARRFIKQIAPEKSQDLLELFPLNKHTAIEDKQTYLSYCLSGFPTGIISDAGCPAIADPGSEIVHIAHQKGIRVIPLVGPSSLLLSLMASGMNGQSFAFNGYLPIDKNERRIILRKLERRAKEEHQSQLFIETPYRNESLLQEMLQILAPQTDLCIACDITLPEEFIHTYTIREWKRRVKEINIHKRPTIFIIY
ncbi:SAM-dependent methyltransferase [Capnocytophaga sp. G2]|uniref:SAM-dependent methyltransferase n=1 Tax=Capnocytophaga sp. G2 TaxID=3110695 RepID=UPI002B4923B6|nr:SAM-dependent methyltransferase [Capnocytophaga sp. G2]MEB3004934.1 SAM-dependent methyltransferase [Capnocytophaga sp. G2]